MIVFIMQDKITANTNTVDESWNVRLNKHKTIADFDLRNELKH